jgi:hypothetical protein
MEVDILIRFNSIRKAGRGLNFDFPKGWTRVLLAGPVGGVLLWFDLTNRLFEYSTNLF